MTWFILALVSIIALATAELVQQYVLKDGSEIDERVSGVLTFLVQSTFTIPIIMFSGLRQNVLDIFNPNILPYIAITTVLASFGLTYYLKSFKVKNISTSTIFVSLSVVVSTILGIIFFKESVYPEKILGIVLIIIAVVSLNIRNITLEKNHLYGLLAGIFFGTTYVFDKVVVLQIHPLVYLFWSFTLVSLFLFATSPNYIIKKVRKLNLKKLTPVFVSGTGYFIYNLCTFTAYTVGGEVGRIDAINNSQIFLIILVEYILFKQKTDVVRKIVTAMVAFTGVFILGTM